MRTSRIKDFLDTNHVNYSTISHPTSYTAQGTAAMAHVSGNELAKTIIVNADGQLAMAVLPGAAQLDLVAFKKLMHVKSASLASELEFADKFPDCDLGAMPPFGNLYKIPVYVDEKLSLDKEIAFNAGSHSELVLMKYEDFERLVSPTVGSFALGPSQIAA